MKLSKNYLRKVIKESIGQVKQVIREEEEQQQGDKEGVIEFGSVKVSPQAAEMAKNAFSLLVQGKPSQAQQLLKQLNANDMGRVAVAAMALDIFANWDEQELKSAITQAGITAARTPE